MDEFEFFEIANELYRLPGDEVPPGRMGVERNLSMQKFSHGGFWMVAVPPRGETPRLVTDSDAELIQRDVMADQPGAIYDPIDAPVKFTGGAQKPTPEWEAFDAERDADADDEGGDEIAPAMDTAELISAGVRVDVPFETAGAGTGLKYDDGPPGDVPETWGRESVFSRGNAAWSRHAAGDEDSAGAAGAQGDAETDGEAAVEDPAGEAEAPPEGAADA